MKKKKLKKEIKELRKEIAHHREMISNLGDKYVKLHTDLTKLTIRCNYKFSKYDNMEDLWDTADVLKEESNGNT